VVVEVAWVNGLAAIRSLGRQGLRVLAVDHRSYALGLRSRYAEARLAPDPLDDEAGFIEALRLIGEETADVLPVFPTHDEHLNAIARHAQVLGERYRFPFPSWDVLERVQSKRHQLETAESVGVPVPRTFHPRTAEEARVAGDEVGFPLVVKPSANVGFRRSHKRQLFRCETPAELDRAYELAGPYEPMVQELIPGGAEEMYTLGSYLDRDGEALGLFSGRKVSQTRGFMGSARVGEALWVEEVVEQGLVLLRALGFHGISQVEVMRDPRDGRYKLLEVNPRLWQWHSLAAACGDARRRQALGDHAHGGVGTRARAAAVRRRRLRARRSEAGARPDRPPRPARRADADGSRAAWLSRSASSAWAMRSRSTSSAGRGRSRSAATR
jgi:predicted ATP-grasp superfamily ATP-dependent carboligase